MANRTIITDYFRASYVHLAQPYAHTPADDAKYMVSMMFPKTGTLPATIGTGATGVTNIMQALNEVCMEQWGMDFQSASASVQFPPEWKDGDQDWKKNDKGMKIVGDVNESSVGMWILSAKNVMPVGTVGPDEQPIDARAVYSGCWCRAQLEVSAYTNKAKSNIIAIQLMNVMKCYDDTNLGGGSNQQSASTAFAGMKVADTNIKVGEGQSFATPTMPGGAVAPALPGASVPSLPVTAPVKPVYEVTAKANGATMGQFLAPGSGWTIEMMLEQGYAVEVKQAVPALPVAGVPSLPGVPAATTAPAMPGQAYLKPPVMPGM